jgi:hypothetical protein
MPYNDYQYLDTPTKTKTMDKRWEDYLKQAEKELDDEPYHVNAKSINDYAKKLYYNDLAEFRKDHGVDVSEQREIDHWKYMYENAMSNHKELRKMYDELKQSDNLHWKAEYEILLRRTQKSEADLENAKVICEDATKTILTAKAAIEDLRMQLIDATIREINYKSGELSQTDMEMKLAPEPTPDYEDWDVNIKPFRGLVRYTDEEEHGETD